jgi:hypothetical protein
MVEYHKVKIDKLSPTQISKLLRGLKVRVRHGSHHHIHVSAEHAKKIMKAHQKGAAHTLELDPYAIEHNMHLKKGGSFMSVMRDIGRTLAPVAHAAAPVALDIGKKLLEKRLGLGMRMHHEGSDDECSDYGGAIGKRRSVSKRGRGLSIRKPVLKRGGVRRVGRPRKIAGSALYPAGYGESIGESLVVRKRKAPVKRRSPLKRAAGIVSRKKRAVFRGRGEGEGIYL